MTVLAIDQAPRAPARFADPEQGAVGWPRWRCTRVTSTAAVLEQDPAELLERSAPAAPPGTSRTVGRRGVAGQSRRNRVGPGS